MSKAKPDAWMPMFVADYAADTSRLSLEQHGAYLLLIFDYWRNGPPPDDDAVIARILGVERREWFRLRPVVSAFFSIEGGRWRHKRIDAELDGARTRAEKAHQRATKGAAARWGAADASSNASSNAPSTQQAVLEDMPKRCPSPSPSKKLSPEAKASSESAAAGGAPKPDLRAVIEAIWSAQPVLGGKRRATRPDVAKAFAAAVNRGGDPSEILAACHAYYRLPACTKDAGQFAMGAAVLIEADRWREYLPTVFEGAANSWTGPASIRETVVTEQDEAFARSYLDPATWIDPQSEDVCGSIVARNGYAHGKLKALHCLRDKANLLQPEPKDQAA